MIQYNEEYSLNDGKGCIVFQKGSEDAVSAIYNRGTIHAKWDGNVLKGTFIDTISKGQGLIEFTFDEDCLEAKWKGGIVPGAMRGRWKGILSSAIEVSIPSNETVGRTIFNESDRIEIRVVVQNFDFYAENSISNSASIFGVTGLEIEEVNWRSQSELVESYWWEQEEEFYQFLYENGVEFTAKEYSDWYEFQLTVTDKNGVEVFSEIVRG
jgi:hypothetical protein